MQLNIDPSFVYGLRVLDDILARSDWNIKFHATNTFSAERSTLLILLKRIENIP